MAVTVSIVLPVYNRPDSLRDAIVSVLSQSFRDFELIVVDDASVKDVTPVIEAIGDPRIRVVRRAVNGGAGAARNTGVAEAKGEFIAFQDSDDIWLPGRLERALGLFAKLPKDVGAVFGDTIVYGQDAAYRFGDGLICWEPSAQWRLSLDGDQQAHLLRRNRVAMQASMFRRDCYPDTVWFDERLRANEDWDFAIRLAGKTRLYEDVYPYVLVFKTLRDHISRNERQKLLALARVMKKNRALFEANPRAHGFQLYRLGGGLIRIGKKRTGWRFLLAGLMKDPRRICRTLKRRLFR